MFHNQSSREEQSNKAPTAINKTTDNDSNGLVDKTPSGPKDSESNFLDNLKPKLKEIVQEIQLEENKLYEEAKKLDPQSLLSKVPLVPTLAHNIPEPLKTRIKSLLGRFQKSDGTDPARNQIKITSIVDATEAASKLLAKGSEKTTPPIPTPTSPTQTVPTPASPKPTDPISSSPVSKLPTPEGPEVHA